MCFCQGRTMKRAPTDEPNLDDILARDFSELNMGEEQITTEAPQEMQRDEAEGTDEAKAKPIIYNQKIDAREDRESFSVAPPSSASSAKNGEKNTTSTPSTTILKVPTSQLGDDFDVEW